MTPGSEASVTDFDLIVIGSGPAGMAAACCASSAGATVCLIDEQSTAGGQIYRQVSVADPEVAAALGSDYAEGRGWVNSLSASPVHCINQATVWRVDPDGTVCFSVAGRGKRLCGRQLIVATGALERPVAYPGWTLPGVMSAGAAQILIKSGGLCPRNAVLVGSGPLLLLLCQQMIAAKCPPLAIVETRNTTWRTVAKQMPGAVAGWRYLVRGLKMLSGIRRAGIAHYREARDIRLEGDDALRGVSFTSRGTEVKIPCRLALLHQGVVPNTQITRSLGLAHQWDAGQACFKPVADSCGRTALTRILVAGDGAGIIGAQASLIAGELAAVSALQTIGSLSESIASARLKQLHKCLRRELAIRPLLDALYFPPDDVLRPGDDTVICRCESVTAGEVRNYARLGCVGPNQTKAFGRVGMGLCQGRYCGLTVTNLLAQANGIDEPTIGYYRIRPPIKPVTLGELADLADQSTD